MRKLGFKEVNLPKCPSFCPRFSKQLGRNRSIPHKRFWALLCVVSGERRFAPSLVMLILVTWLRRRLWGFPPGKSLLPPL